jgi:PadR family transcriptional regulator PadR
VVNCLAGRPNVALLRMRAEELKGHLDGLLLAALEDGPRHGYAVIEALRQATDGQLDMATGTVYPALRRLEQAGLVTGSWSVVAGRRRREYRLTAAGADTLAGRRSQWRDFAAMISGALEGRPWPKPA